MKKVYILYLFLLGFSFFTVNGQEVLTLERCRELALENNKQLSISGENRKKASYEKQAYRSNYFPKFSATGNYLYTTTRFNKSLPESYLPTFVSDGNGNLTPNLLTSVNGNPIFKEYAYFPGFDLDLTLRNTYMAGVTIEQPIYMGGKITAAYKMSKIGEQMAGLNQELTRAEVLLLCDEAYWIHTQTLELSKTAQDYKTLIQKLLNDVENAWRAGMKPHNDVLKVQVKLNEAELQVLQAENGVRLSRMNLCHVIGIPLTSHITVSEDSGVKTIQTVLSASITERPEYGMLTQQIELKEQETKLVRSEFLPTIGVAGNYGYANGLKLNGEKLLDKSSFSAIVSVNIPLFNWGEGRNKIRSIKVEQNIALLQREDFSEKMELELMQATNELEEAYMEVLLTTRSLEQAEENLKVSRAYYDAGMETLTDYLEAQTLWQKACSDLIRSKTSVNLNQTKYLKATGKL